MKKILFLCCIFFFGMSAICLAAGEKIEEQKIVVVPYLDTTEESHDRGYVPDFMKRYYEDAMKKQMGWKAVPKEEVQKSLKAAGYDVSNLMLPNKEMMAEIARLTGADYVVAAELSSLKDSKHKSYFQKKVRVTVKMKYNFYIAGSNKFLEFQVAEADENRSMIGGGLSTKNPIHHAIEKAAKKADKKIKEYAEANGGL